MCADVSSPTRFLTGIAERFQRRQAQVVGDRHLVESCDDFRNLINRGVPVVVRDCLPERDGVAAEHDGLIKREGAHRGIGGEVLRDLRLGRELVGPRPANSSPGNRSCQAARWRPASPSARFDTARRCGAAR